MPNQRSKDKVQMLGCWLTKGEKKMVDKDMKKLGIEAYSDYMLYKLGLERGGDKKDG